MKKINILDCTLRDGGYYNNWVFSEDLINDYLAEMSSLNVDYIELGFRSQKRSGFKGPCAYTTDAFLNTLNIPHNINLGVMINASEFSDEFEFESRLLQCFSPAVDSQVKLVRVASHIEELNISLKIASFLKSLGYSVGINVMQISEATEETIVEFSKKVTDEICDVVYFADSLGNLEPRDIERIISYISQGWKGEIGIHTHDNLGLSMLNTREAIHCGASWIDSTITGMGRGPGNLQTEYALIEFSDNYDLNKYANFLQFIEKYFKPMQQYFGWGKNPYYYLSGKNSIHPTYVQDALNDKRYSNLDILALIDHLGEVGGTKFIKDVASSQLNSFTKEFEGEWSPKDLLQDKKVLIIGSGPSCMKHKQGIENFIKVNKPLVISLNLNEYINPNLIDLLVACQPMRVISDIDKYQDFNIPLVLPFDSMPELVKEKLTNVLIYNFALTTSSNEFLYKKSSANIPISLAFGYALSIANSGCSSSILIAGFDGFDDGDIRNDEMAKLIEIYKNNQLSTKVISITPTKYDFEIESLYAL